MLADPPHGPGIRDKVPPMARAAIAAGADGLLIEVHNDPEHALSDGAQALFFEQFEKLIAELRIIAPAVERTIAYALAAVFRRVAVLATGLIGGSFALALRKYFPDTTVVGWDKAHVLRHAFERAAIHEGVGDLSLALAGADLIYVALPVGQTIELLPEVARLAPPHSLVTDTASTKRSVCAVAAESFHEYGTRFL